MTAETKMMHVTSWIRRRSVTTQALHLLVPTTFMLDVAIAFVIFNRPDSTRLSFERIRQARPKRLYLIGDAPRPDREGEAELVAEARSIAENVDWPCQVREIYADTNLGCATRISSGISEILRDEDRLIVLEDDCVADPTFFSFCDEILDRYEDDERVMAVTGNNFQQGTSRTDASYYFSKYPHCWGWATWRRAWSHFRLEMDRWPAFRDQGHLAANCSTQIEIDYWIKMFNRVHDGQISSWAFPWTLSCWMQNGLTVIPDVNLVTNIGFGQHSTHTKDENDVAASLATERLSEIVHPELMIRHIEADNFTDRTVFSRNRPRGLIRRVGRALPKLRRAA